MAGYLRLGMIGCGGISHSHGEAAAKVPEKARFVACCDIRKGAAEQWAEKYAAERSYADHLEMLRQERLDAVFVATWPIDHRRHVEDCLAAGIKNILCEKALTLTGEDAMAIWRQVHAHSAFVMEGFMYRHNRTTRRIDRLLAMNEIGPVDNVHGVFNAYDSETPQPGDASRDWRQRKECGGGVPYDYTCYPINGCTHYIKELPVRVFAVGYESARYGTVNRLYAMIEYANQKVGVVETTRKVDLDEELKISGAMGEIRTECGWTPVTLNQVDKVHCAWPTFHHDAFAIPFVDAYYLQLENFLGVIRGEAVPGMPLVESVVNTFIVEAVVKSMAERRAVEIRIPDEIARAASDYWQKERARGA